MLTCATSSSRVLAAAAKPSARRLLGRLDPPDHSRPVPRLPSAIARYASATGQRCCRTETASSSASVAPSTYAGDVARAPAATASAQEQPAPPRCRCADLVLASSPGVRPPARGVAACPRSARRGTVRAAAHSGQLRAVGQPCGGIRASTRSTAARSAETSSGSALGDEQPAEQRPVLGVGGVAQRLDRVPVLGEPPRGPSVQVRHAARAPRPPAGAAASRAAVRGSGTTRGPGRARRRTRWTLSSASRCCWAVRLVGEHLGEAAAQPLDDRGPQQEPLHVRRLAREHLLGQVAR